MGCSCSKSAAQSVYNTKEDDKDEKAAKEAAGRETAAKEAAEQGVSEYTVTRGGIFGKALENGTVAVIKGGYFVDCLRSGKSGKPFAHRAKIEEEAPDQIFKGSEAARLWYENGQAFLVVLSYCWLSKEHPDPQMFYLPYLNAIIEAMKEHYRVTEVGIILDYTSFYQEPRTDEQQKSFDDCLSMINVPYGHKDVTAVKLVSVPAEEKRTYDDRGWTKFESDVIDSKPSSEVLVDGNLNVLSCNTTSTNLDMMSKCRRRPPLAPARFKAEMEERRQRAVEKGVNLFTNGKDQAFLEDKYTDTFTKMAKSATRLDFQLMKIGDAGVEQLSEALVHFERLADLCLVANQITDVKSLAKVLGKGAAPKLEWLNLTLNHLGEGSVRELAEALRSGGAPQLKFLEMTHNAITDEGQQLLKEAAAGRDLRIHF